MSSSPSSVISSVPSSRSVSPLSPSHD
jgi:hypothetical protein